MKICAKGDTRISAESPLLKFGSIHQGIEPRDCSLQRRVRKASIPLAMLRAARAVSLKRC